MSREITKRFAAIDDELSPPKPKPAPPKAAPPPPREPVTVLAESIAEAQDVIKIAMDRGDSKLVDAVRRRLDELCREQMAQSGLREATVDSMKRARWVRQRVINELGPGLSSSDIDGIVQAEIEYENARMAMDAKKAQWWDERRTYIKYQARKQSRGMVPFPIPSSGLALNQMLDTFEYARAEIEKVTGIKLDQHYDLAKDCLVVRYQYPDGTVLLENIDRLALMDGINSLCNKCGKLMYYPDGKTYHLCSAVLDNAKLYNGNYNR